MVTNEIPYYGPPEWLADQKARIADEIRIRFEALTTRDICPRCNLSSVNSLGCVCCGWSLV